MGDERFMKEKKTLYVYALAPIDNWLGWTPLADLIQPARTRGSDVYPVPFAEIGDCLERGFKVARMALRWEGDIREGPYVAGLPISGGGGDDCAFTLAWKQDHAGICYVVSPIRLAHLENPSGWSLEWTTTDTYHDLVRPVLTACCRCAQGNRA